MFNINLIESFTVFLVRTIMKCISCTFFLSWTAVQWMTSGGPAIPSWSHLGYTLSLDVPPSCDHYITAAQSDGTQMYLVHTHKHTHARARTHAQINTERTDPFKKRGPNTSAPLVSAAEKPKAPEPSSGPTQQTRARRD